MTQYSTFSPVDAIATTMEFALKVTLRPLGVGGEPAEVRAPAPRSTAGTVAVLPLQLLHEKSSSGCDEGETEGVGKKLGVGVGEGVTDGLTTGGARKKFGTTVMLAMLDQLVGHVELRVMTSESVDMVPQTRDVPLARNHSQPIVSSTSMGGSGRPKVVVPSEPRGKTAPYFISYVPLPTNVPERKHQVYDTIP